MNVPAVLWEHSMQSFLAARIAEVEYDEAVYYPACDEQESGGAPVPDDVAAMTDTLTEARCAAEEALIFTPTNALANIIWKIAYARKRWEDHCEWPDDWWEAVIADLHRIDTGKGGAA